MLRAPFEPAFFQPQQSRWTGYSAPYKAILIVNSNHIEKHLGFLKWDCVCIQNFQISLHSDNTFSIAVAAAPGHDQHEFSNPTIEKNEQFSNLLTLKGIESSHKGVINFPNTQGVQNNKFYMQGSFDDVYPVVKVILTLIGELEENTTSLKESQEEMFLTFCSWGNKEVTESFHSNFSLSCNK